MSVCLDHLTENEKELFIQKGRISTLSLFRAFKLANKKVIKQTKKAK